MKKEKDVDKTNFSGYNSILMSYYFKIISIDLLVHSVSFSTFTMYGWYNSHLSITNTNKN